MTASLDLLTFENLVHEIGEMRDKARSHSRVSGWNQLLEVAEEFAAGGRTDDDPSVGKTWYLTKIRVQGYQGIGSELLEVEFSPTPGVTVIHGPNGSGKSSIADAVETGLNGFLRRSMPTGGGGTEPLWERQHIGRDADEAQIELTLSSGTEQMSLVCRIGADDTVAEWRVVRNDGGPDTQVDLAKTTWGSALAGYRPVFGYAAVERQVQLAKNLQEFLEPLLAFGGCFEELNTAVGGFKWSVRHL
jgi:hypothetical protein